MDQTFRMMKRASKPSDLPVPRLHTQYSSWAAIAIPMRCILLKNLRCASFALRVKGSVISAIVVCNGFNIYDIMILLEQCPE